MEYAENYIRIRQELDGCCKGCGRDPEDVLLLAVSKTVGIDAVQDAFDAGCRDFGENRPEGLIEKSAAFPEARWHFIGNVQSRRIRDIVSCAYLIHSICKPEHLPKLDAAAREAGKVQRFLIEVNVSGEESKSGVTPEMLPRMHRESLDYESIECVGLMTMAPLGDLEEAKSCFEGLRSLMYGINEELASQGSPKKLTQLSMGMTDDWELAVEKGSTIVRLGRAIFS